MYRQKSPEIDKHIELFIRKFREHTYYSMLRRSYDKIHIKIAAGNTWYIPICFFPLAFMASTFLYCEKNT